MAKPLHVRSRFMCEARFILVPPPADEVGIMTVGRGNRRSVAKRYPQPRVPFRLNGRGEAVTDEETALKKVRSELIFIKAGSPHPPPRWSPFPAGEG